MERTTGKEWFIRILPRNCAIISKKPILMHGNMFLTPIQITENKIINVISSHQFVYTYLPYDIYNGMKNEPVIFTGDFNEPSHLDYTQKAVEKGYVKASGLNGLMSNVLLNDMNMKDVWKERRVAEKKDECSQRGITWSPTTWNYRKGIDDQRIDFIYYTPTHLEYVDAKLLGEVPKIPVEGDIVDLQFADWPSDHRGILGVLHLK